MRRFVVIPIATASAYSQEWKAKGVSPARDTERDRVWQALLNRLEPIFEPIFDDANFGYRRGRSTKDAMRKIWLELKQGYEWVVDADLRDFFGSADHEKLMELLNQRVADGRVLRLLKSMRKWVTQGKQVRPAKAFPVSPLLQHFIGSGDAP